MFDIEMTNTNTELLGIMWEDKNLKEVELSEYEIEKQRMNNSKMKKHRGIFHFFRKNE